MLELPCTAIHDIVTSGRESANDKLAAFAGFSFVTYTWVSRALMKQELAVILGLEIGMIIYGLIALTTGKFIVTKTRVVTGKLARQLGILLLLPIPIAYTAHGLVHYHFVQNRRPVGTDSRFLWTMIAVEAGIVIGCFLIAYATGWLATAFPDAFTKELAPAASSSAPFEITSLGKGFVKKPEAVEESGPELVCTKCSRGVRLGADGRKPPWCPGCGANL